LKDMFITSSLFFATACIQVLVETDSRPVIFSRRSLYRGDGD
jgi:hypothetical protein